MGISLSTYRRVLPHLLACLTTVEICAAAQCGRATVQAAVKLAKRDGIDLRRHRGKVSGASQKLPSIVLIERLRRAETILIHGASVYDLRDRLGLSLSTARRLLRDLVVLGATIESAGDSKMPTWRLARGTRVFAPRAETESKNQ